MYCTVHMKIR